MAHGKRGISLVKQVEDAYKDKLAIGQSKHFDKSHGGIKDKIYSWNTFRTYMKHANYFVAYCKETYRCRTLEECRPYADEWLKSRAELSAYTQKMEASALAKLYGITTKDLAPTATRHRADITRSREREGIQMDKHFSETRNEEFVSFCRHTGLRRSEIRELRSYQLLKQDGKYYIAVSGKGGRYRKAPIIGSDQEVERIIRRIENAGNGFVWDKMPANADIHSYRSEYATSVYRSLARPKEEIPKEDRYCCRGDLKGVWYDKPAMLEASRALGHNRVSVIAGHYIRG